MRVVDALLPDLHALCVRLTPQPDRHAHLRCTTCGQLHDVDVDLSGLVLPIEQQRGFTIEGAEVTFSGRCRRCARRAGQHRAGSRATNVKSNEPSERTARRKDRRV